MNNFFNNGYIQNILSGIVGAAIFYFLQKWLDKKDKKKEHLQNSIVGRKDMKILAPDFLYQYEPGGITIEKIIEEFGQPVNKTDWVEDQVIYFFEFQNAKIAMNVEKQGGDIISITALSRLDNKHLVNCRLSFEEDDEALGKASISDVIIKDHFLFDSQMSQVGYYTTIGCSNAHRPSKHLTFYYEIEGKFDSIQEAKGEIIKQVCVLRRPNIPFFFSLHETMLY
jgi:hypothetical protein